ncbi:MAG TPA: glycosyltransferase family 2 protein [Planctomycetota bacterium]|nr:glycosyltransferase family 2 protein [Planctomycetota bacterium]
MPSVSIIIVNLNGERLLDDCLNSLNAQTYRDFEVVFVDNGSKDGSVEKARALMPSANIIALNENTGFARGNNIGIAAAKGRYIVLLNNDTRSDPNFLEELVKPVESDKTIGMVAPKILNFFDQKIIDSVGGLLMCRDGIGQGRGRGEVDSGQYDAATSALLPSGCAALYLRELLDEVGLLDEEFFAYCEDSDLGLRAVWAGWKTASAPRAVVYHKYSATTSSYSPFKMLLVERNHYFLALKNYPLRLLVFLPFWTFYRYVLMGIAVLSGKGKGGAAGGGGFFPLLGAFIKGHWQALVGAPRQLRRGPKVRRITSKAFAALLKEYRIPVAHMIFNE